jgi:hypothetical protein
MAAIDLALTAVVAAAVAAWLGVRVASCAFLSIVAVLMLVSLAVHRLFCVDTALTVAVFGPYQD